MFCCWLLKTKLCWIASLFLWQINHSLIISFHKKILIIYKAVGLYLYEQYLDETGNFGKAIILAFESQKIMLDSNFISQRNEF